MGRGIQNRWISFIFPIISTILDNFLISKNGARFRLYETFKNHQICKKNQESIA